jgi:hypothetical protein
MTRAVVFLAAAMVAASLGVGAQDVSGGGTNSAPQNNSDNNPQHTVTVTGCLSSLGTGVYTLSADQGTTYTLAGNTVTLQGHTAQEIEVTGQQAFGSDTSSNPSSGPASAATPTIQVTTTKLVADHCNSSANPQPNASGPGAAASAGASTSRDSLKSATTRDRSPNVQSPAQGDESAIATNGQLPQTSTILPLLGLIGLGSLVAGFFARH